jgi:DNA polymerase (family 10)
MIPDATARSAARRLRQAAAGLEYGGDDSFRGRAFRRAARCLERLDYPILLVWLGGRLQELPGVGEGIAASLDGYLRTGLLDRWEEARAAVPERLHPLLAVPSMPGAALARLVEGTGSDDPRALEESLRSFAHRELGMEDADGRRLLRAVRVHRRAPRRPDPPEALVLEEEMADLLETVPGVRAVSPVGRLRRRAFPVAELELLLASPDPHRAVEGACALGRVAEVLEAEPGAARVRLQEGVGLVVSGVEEEALARELLLRTGSPAHVEELARRAADAGLPSSHPPLWDPAGPGEEGYYAAVSLDPVAPELREAPGPDRAAAGPLPTCDDLRGDAWVEAGSDRGLRELGRASLRAGLRWLIVFPAPGTPLRDHVARVERSRDLFPSLRLLAGGDEGEGADRLDAVRLGDEIALGGARALLVSGAAAGPEIESRARAVLSGGTCLALGSGAQVPHEQRPGLLAALSLARRAAAPARALLDPLAHDT